MERQVSDLSQKIVALPADVVAEILAPFRPRFTRPHNRHVDIFACWKGAYFIALHQLAQWRLTCRTWYYAITPLLYSNIIIHFTPMDRPSRRLKFAQFHPHLVRNLVVRVSGIPEDLSLEDARREVFDAVRRCEGLVRLEFYDLPILFTGMELGDIERWFRGFIPPTLTTLVFRSSLTLMLDAGESRSPHAMNVMTSMLRGLGSGVECIPDLQLLLLSPVAWTYQLPSLPIHLPSLERLVLYGFDLGFMTNLMSCISSPNPPAAPSSAHLPLAQVFSSAPTPLRDLTISRISNYHLDISSLHTLFNINNIGLNLTSLRIQKLHMHNFLVEPEVPIEVLRLCPSLERFFFITRSTQSWIDIVPSDGQCGVYVTDLGIIPHLSYRASTMRFVEVVSRLREVWGSELKRLHLNLEADYAAGPLSQREWEEVEKACWEVGLELVEDRYAIP